MKKIYFVGDILNDTGPAIVNKSYYPYLNDEVIFCKTNKKILRILHFFFFFLNKKTIIISGFSKLNYYFSKIAKIFNKNVIYIMHGYIKEEMKFSNKINPKKEKIEYNLLKNVDKILCVSEFFANFMKNKLPEFKDKISFVNNGIIEVKSRKTKNKNNDYIIISVGGGVRQKNNLAICQAIDKLKDNKIRFIVIGSLGSDGNKIKEYSFVEYYERLPHEEVLEKMSNSDLYIQNSYFETFGLAIVESINCGCDLLISKNVGVLSILNGIEQKDIIYDNDNIEEISEKIYNKTKFRSNIYYNSSECSWKNRSNELLEKVKV